MQASGGCFVCEIKDYKKKQNDKESNRTQSVPDDGNGALLPQQGIIHQETGQPHRYDLVSLKEQEEPMLGKANQGRKCQPALTVKFAKIKRDPVLLDISDNKGSAHTSRSALPIIFINRTSTASSSG